VLWVNLTLLLVQRLIYVLQLTIWFPLRLRRAIQEFLPKVDQYTEFGKLRSNSELNREYQRLLARDQSPFSFLYKGPSFAYYLIITDEANLQTSAVVGAHLNLLTCLLNFAPY
jgi:hypothetical protein